jgi:hypothetical protein
MKTNSLLFFVIASLVVVSFAGCNSPIRNTLFPAPPGQGQVVTIGNKSFESPSWAPIGGKNSFCGSSDTIIIHNIYPRGYFVRFIEQGTPRFVLSPGEIHTFNPTSSRRNFPLDIQAVVFVLNDDGSEQEVKIYDQIVEINSSYGQLTLPWTVGLYNDSSEARYMRNGY